MKKKLWNPICDSGWKKIFFMMRITVFFLLAGFLQVSASVYSQQTNLHLKAENVSVSQVLKMIEEQSDFHFLYRSDYFDEVPEVTIETKDAKLEDVLNKIIVPYGFAYEIDDKTVVIRKSDVPRATEISAPQKKSVSGKVTDSSGAPLPGVSVVIKGTTIGVTTDTDGQFGLSVPTDAKTLVFSFVGMKTQEFFIGDKTLFAVKLEEETVGLDEVVAIGYGTMKKSDLTGSVVRVSMEGKASIANLDLTQALSGAIAGVNVQNTGLAGSEGSLSIRGQTSLSATDSPLIVLDGIIYNGAISNINVNDVETIDILKDASSAAVYGSRSANGVLLITTKKGKTDKPVIAFNMHYGYQDMTNNPMKVMNAEQYAVRLVDYYYQQDLYKWYATKPTSATGKPVRPDVTDRNIVASRLRTQEERDNYLAGNEINWVDEVTRLAPIQEYNLSFSGKNDRTNYFVSGSYTNEEGILLNNQYSRLTVHSNIESKVTDWFTLGLNSSYSYSDHSGLPASLTDARNASPLANNKIGSPNFDMFLTKELYMNYPLTNLYVDNSNIRNDFFLVASAKMTIPWVKGLTYELNYSNTYSILNNNTFYPVTTSGGTANKGQASKISSDERDWIVNNIVTYLRTFGDHFLNATLLYSREKRHAQGSTLSASGFDNPILGYNNMGLATLPSISSSAWEENSLSYMARLNYTFKNRYLFTSTIRQDGFSGFGANNKYAIFPSVSLGWVASEESFLKDVNWLYLKLRTSYGKNGNQGIGRYSSFSTMAYGKTVYGSSTAIGIYPSTMGNADLGWETTSSYNLGIDFGFMNRKISGSVDVYTAKTADVLVQKSLPPTTGYGSVWSNIGGIDNKGIELELTTINLDGKLSWKTNFVFSLNRDRLTTLYGNKSDKDIGNSWFVGEPISSIYDYQMAGGLWTEAELYAGKTLNNWYPGQYKYVDQNKDGFIEPNADRKIIGYKTPNYRFSISNILSYKNFSLSFMINSIQGGNGYYLADNYSAINVSSADIVYRTNASAVRPYWTPDNGVNNSTGIYNAPMALSGIYQSRSFVRLQDISLLYNVKSKSLKNCQIFVSGKNLYTWTKWSGWDPEIGTSDSPLMRNITTGFRFTL